MSEMEEKLGAILGDPQMMQQIMSMAQALNASSPEPASEPERADAGFPNIDPGMLNSLAGMAQSSRIDENQQCLLNALCPYMSQNRVHKLEKAMRAAKIAGLASSFLNAGGLKLLAGR